MRCEFPCSPTRIVLNYTWYRDWVCSRALQVNFHSLGRSDGPRPPWPAHPRHAAAAVPARAGAQALLRGLRRCRSLANHVGQVVDAAHEVVGEGGAQVALQRLNGALARHQSLVGTGGGKRTRAA